MMTNRSFFHSTNDGWADMVAVLTRPTAVLVGAALRDKTINIKRNVERTRLAERLAGVRVPATEETERFA